MPTILLLLENWIWTDLNELKTDLNEVNNVNELEPILGIILMLPKLG